MREEVFTQMRRDCQAEGQFFIKIYKKCNPAGWFTLIGQATACLGYALAAFFVAGQVAIPAPMWVRRPLQYANARPDDGLCL
jgi:hypothetical protein